MQLFAPNVLVVGDRIYELDDAVGKPQSQALAGKYETEVIALRARILAQPFGARWFDIVGNNKEPIVIVPTTATNQAVAQTFENVKEKPNRLADSLAKGFSDPSIPAGVGPGTGAGTPVRVKFNTAASVGSMAGAASGEVLLMHELTHAYRSAGGRFAPTPMAGLVNPQRLRGNPDLAKRFPDWEEWFAVVVENVFAAESGRHILRAHWDLLFPATATSPAYFQFWNIGTVGSRTDSEEFADDYAPAVRQIASLEPKLFSAMVGSNAWFNPVRDLALLTRK
jgi:hypothetical protein